MKTLCVPYLLNDVLGGAGAGGLDHRVGLLRRDVVDLDEEHLLLPSSSPLPPSQCQLVLSCSNRRASLITVLKQ